jgi:hypothetical protein
MTQAADYIATLVEQLKSIAQPAGLTAPFAYPLAMAEGGGTGGVTQRLK